MSEKLKPLTKKEREAVELFLTGENQTTAVFKAFDCKTKATAGVMATKIFSKDKVKREIEKRQVEIQRKLNDKLAKTTLKFVELVEKYAPPHKIAQRLAENILSQDRRVSDSAIDKYIKLRGDYAPSSQLILSKSEIYQEIKELPEEKGSIIEVIQEEDPSKESEPQVKTIEEDV